MTQKNQNNQTPINKHHNTRSLFPSLKFLHPKSPTQPNFPPSSSSSSWFWIRREREIEIMHRSSSTTRASEEQYYSHVTSPPSKPSPGLRIDTDELPVYDPLSDLAKKEKLRIKFAENAVHVIPLVLVICAITLWFFSNPEVGVMNKDGSIVARVEGLRIDTDIDVHVSGTGLVSEQEAMDPHKHKKHHKGGKASKEKSK